MADNILPCPFCKGDIVLLQGERYNPFVRCMECMADGPLAAERNDNQAIALWNAAPRAPQEPKACTWVHVLTEWEDIYTSSCGQDYSFVEGSAEYNGVLYCFNCGGKVTIKEPQPEEEDEA